MQTLLHTRRPQFTKDLSEISLQGSRWFVDRSTPDILASTKQDLTPVDENDLFNETMTSSIRLLLDYGEVASKAYIDAYFRTFGAMYPILCQESLEKQMVSTMSDSSTAIAAIDIVLLLLIVALGHVTYEGSSGAPIE